MFRLFIRKGRIMDKMKNNKTNYGPKPFDYTSFENEHLKCIEYLGKSEWLCECNKCGRTFKSRSNKIKNRLGCISCTASLKSARRHSTIEHYGYINRLYREYKSGACKRNLVFELSFEEFYELLMGDCYYCKSKPREHEGGKPYQVKTLPPLKRNGVDRLDSTIGYTTENVVSCCSKCNYAKHEMSVNEFKDWIIKIYGNFVTNFK